MSYTFVLKGLYSLFLQYKYLFASYSMNGIHLIKISHLEVSYSTETTAFMQREVGSYCTFKGGHQSPEKGSSQVT